MKRDPCSQPDRSQALRDLYPTLSEAQLKEAEANLRRYVEIADEVRKEQLDRGTVFDTIRNSTTMEERSNADLKT
jgi:hypothetical protein